MTSSSRCDLHDAAAVEGGCWLRGRSLSGSQRAEQQDGAQGQDHSWLPQGKSRQHVPLYRKRWPLAQSLTDRRLQHEQVWCHAEINRIFEMKVAPTKTLPNAKPMTLVADSVHSRDMIVLVLRALNTAGL